MVQVKICGLRRPEEVEAAVEAGADYLGFVFYPPSHRYLTPEAARDLLQAVRRPGEATRWRAVGVFVNEPAAWVNRVAGRCGLDYVQLHGTESPEYCAAMERPAIKALRLAELNGGPVTAEAYGAARLLLDSQVPGYWGGTGQRFDWEAARPYAREAFIAGGLAPENAAAALTLLDPWGLDVSSGVERDKVKDPALIRAFLANVRRWEKTTHGD